jgi:amino acid transporter
MSELSACDARGGLRRDQLGFADVVAQAIGTIAPSGTPALVIPAVFAAAGNGTWLAYLFATLALVVLSLNINAFAARSASPGALYSFAGQGLGAFWGTIAGWSLVIAYLFTAGAVVQGAGNYALVFLHSIFGEFRDFGAAIVVSLAVIALAWWVAFRSIRLSTRLSLTLEGVTVVAILIVLVSWVTRGGVGADKPQLTLEGVSFEQVRLGLVLAFFSFVGFESATVLGHEARAPLRVIPRSVITTVLAIGVFFVISSYVSIAAFRSSPVTLDKADAPLSWLASGVGLGVFGPIIAIGVAASFFASTLASINAGARVIYLLSRHGVLHVRAGDAHTEHATPHVAVTISAIVTLVLALPLTIAGVGFLDAFGYLGNVATFGFLVSYILVSIGAPVFLKRRGELQTRHIVVSALSVLLLLVPLVGVLYPVPDFPIWLLPIIFAGLIALGVLWFLILRWRSPQVLNLIARDLETASAHPAE